MTQPYDSASAPTEPEPSGDPRVDAGVARLAELDDLPVSRHVEVFDDIHARLRDALESAAEDATPA